MVGELLAAVGSQEGGSSEAILWISSFFFFPCIFVDVLVLYTFFGRGGSPQMCILKKKKKEKPN